YVASPLPHPITVPTWIAEDRTPQPFDRAGVADMPLLVTIIVGEPHRFRPLIDLYREAGKRSGHAPERLKVGIHALGYVADTDQQAADDFFPGYADASTKIGKQPGRPPITRRQLRALRRPPR